MNGRSLIEDLEHDIPRAEERLGSDARIVREMRRQLDGLRAEQRLRDQLVFPNPTKVEIGQNGLVIQRNPSAIPSAPSRLLPYTITPE